MSEEQTNEPKSEPYIKVNVARDRMVASLQIDMPEGAPPVTVEEAMDKIKISGVVFGIDEEAVQKACRQPGVPFDVAKGRKALDGTDAVIKHHVGTYMAIGTTLEVGVNPMLRDEYQNIGQELKKVAASLDQVQKTLHILKAMDPNRIPRDKKDMLLKLTKTKFHLVGQSESLRRRMVEIEQDFEEMKSGRILVANAIFPGGKVVVGNLAKTIRETLQSVSLYAEDGEVRIGAYK